MDDRKAKAAAILALAERCLRPFDLLDGVIRRSVVAIFDKEWDPQRPLVAGMQATLSQLQLAIGQQLRAEYDMPGPMPGRIVELLKQLEPTRAAPDGWQGT